MTDKKTEALRLALEALEFIPESGSMLGSQAETKRLQALAAIREALADSALDRMANNARELGLDYEPPCKTGSQCTSKCQQCEQPAQQEPHGWYIDGYGAVLGASEPKSVRPGEWLPFYTSPPASKPWQGLTYGEVLEQKKDDPIQFYRAIEAQLREKNNG